MFHEKNDQRISKTKRYLLMIAAILSVSLICMAGSLFAKYIFQRTSEQGQIVADDFYFTASLLEDTAMAQSQGMYEFGTNMLTGEWYLFGGASHTITINVQNFYDSLRRTEKEITYVAALDTVSKENSVTVKDDSDTSVDGTSRTMSGDAAVTHTLELTIPAYNTWQYENNTIVTLTICSTSPYKKTLTLNFHLYSADTVLKYQVRDSVGSPYAELIIMDNVTDSDGQSTTVQPYIKWADGLEIDRTNDLTYTLNGGTFIQQAVSNNTMQVSQEFETGRSESIVFFKSDTEENHTTAITVVYPDSDGRYEIEIR